MECMDTIFFILSLCLKIFTIYFAGVALFALRPRKRYPHAAPQTRFAVVVAARNEEAVIGDLVYSVLNQDYPPELRDVYVVPNNCTDGTEAAALSAGAKIIRCVGPVSGKGDALHQAFEKLLHQDYDAFVVFDADNTLAPDYLARMNDALLAGAKVCKSRTKASNPRASGVAGCYGLYNACFDLIWNRPRSACGLSAKLIGTGASWRTWAAGTPAPLPRTRSLQVSSPGRATRSPGCPRRSTTTRSPPASGCPCISANAGAPA